MAKRTPALSTQLKNAQIEIDILQKKVKSVVDSSDYLRKQADDATKELQQIHAFLDAVPNPPARKTEGQYNEHTAMTRLSVFLATRGGY